MKGFDTDFWFGVAVVILLVGLDIAIAEIFQINFTFVVLGSLVFLCGVLHIWGKMIDRASPEDTPLIYCEWQDRLNAFDFDANQASTISSLKDLSLTLEASIGMSFTFHSEPGLKKSDVYFEGVIMRNSKGNIIIRSLKPIKI